VHRFYLPPDSGHGSVLTLTDREAHHASRVLRLRRGDAATVLDGQGTVNECIIAEVARDTVRLEVRERRLVPAPASAMVLLQAVPKGRLIETIIQKAVELGARRVVPLLTERVVSDLEEKAEAKASQWRLAAIEAIKQCGAPWLPTVDSPIPLPTFLSRGELFELSLVASLQPGSRHPREWFDAFRREQDRAPRSVAVWVGPEGDFTKDEVTSIERAGALPITLGQLVLRSDTAALYCLSLVNYELSAR
jgi:16S rRNA (uracil1498-N3)-methyltransferase